MVSSRGLEVLRAIVQDYVSSREPVGSQGIVDRHNFGVSAATIRNDMALLEEEDLIAAPHTSSGRVPTDKGYRLFVDHLAGVQHITTAQKHAIERFLDESSDFDELLGRTVRLLSQLTNQVAVVQYPTLGTTRLRRVELVALGHYRVLCVVITDNGRVEQRLVETDRDYSDQELSSVTTVLNDQSASRALADLDGVLSEFELKVSPEVRPLASGVVRALFECIHATRQQKLVMAGTGNLVRTEPDFGGTMHSVLDAIEEQVILLKLFNAMSAEGESVSVSIGREHSDAQLVNASVMTTSYSAGGEASTLGLVGPTRMDYSGNIAAIRAVARYLSNTLDTSS